MRTAARVVDVRDDRARLACDQQPSSCQACAAGRGCALRWLGSAASTGLEVPSVTREGVPLLAGQTVTIDMPDGELLKSAARIYLLPLAGLLAGPGLVRWSGAAGEVAALLAAASGVALGWALARSWVRRSPPRFDVLHDQVPNGR